VIQNIPQTLGLSQDEIDNMPKFVRKYSCGNQMESGAPLCENFDKYNPMCPNRIYMANWHPGWYVRIEGLVKSFVSRQEYDWEGTFTFSKNLTRCYQYRYFHHTQEMARAHGKFTDLFRIGFIDGYLERYQGS
jgi:hypothetical protein